MYKILLPMLILLFPTISFAERLPKVAVMDLTYEEKVSQYIQFSASHEKTSIRLSRRGREHESGQHYSQSSRDRLDQKSERTYVNASGHATYIDRGELRKFTGDIKGEMLKSGSFRLTQGKPYASEKKTEEIYDIIKRVKAGFYPGADYVLFGTLSNIEWRDETNPVQGTDTVSKILSLELVADFSLINTKTYEVKAAFSAMGEGQDVKLAKPGSSLIANRGKVISEVSKSLGADVAHQLEEQFTIETPKRSYENTSVEKHIEEKVIIYQ